MLRGFKEFIMRGNVIDLAVGLVIGAAFTGLVSQLTKSFLDPLIRVFTGGSDPIKRGVFLVRGQPFDWASFVNAVVTFALTAAALYFLVVLPMNKLTQRRTRGQKPAPAPPSEEIVLLREIRDALIAQSPNGREAPTHTGVYRTTTSLPSTDGHA